MTTRHAREYVRKIKGCGHVNKDHLQNMLNELERPEEEPCDCGQCNPTGISGEKENTGIPGKSLESKIYDRVIESYAHSIANNVTKMLSPIIEVHYSQKYKGMVRVEDVLDEMKETYDIAKYANTDMYVFYSAMRKAIERLGK